MSRGIDLHDSSGGYSDEQAQDAVGSILADTATIDFTYDDAGNLITAQVKDNSITYAKIQDVTTGRLLGRDGATNGDPQEITLNGGLEFTGAGGIRRSALTGDVTASAGSDTTSITAGAVTTVKIAADAVDNTKLADMVQNRLKGRVSTGTGDPEDLTPAQVKTILGIKNPTCTILTSGSGTYTLPSGCTAILVECVGGGGGGAGAAAVSSQASAGGGGQAGGYCVKFIDSPASSYAYTVGAGGSGGTAGANNGSDGGTTTFGSPAILTASGGEKGYAMAAGTAPEIRLGQVTLGSASGGDINVVGQAGLPGIRMSATSSCSGAGGPGPWGGGGYPKDANAAAGAAGSGPGAGGSGASTRGTTSGQPGGNGANGIIIITEYYF